MSVIQRQETVKSTFRLEGLHCANCAAKIEQAAAEMDGVSSASLDFAAWQNYDQQRQIKAGFLKAELERLAQSIEPGVKIHDENSHHEHTHVPDARRVLMSLALAWPFGAVLPSPADLEKGAAAHQLPPGWLPCTKSSLAEYQAGSGFR